MMRNSWVALDRTSTAELANLDFSKRARIGGASAAFGIKE
jgi:hypothetical protein